MLPSILIVPGVAEESTDEVLIIRIRQGDQSATEELTKRYYLKVVNICRRYLASPEDAHDAAQEVFTKILAEKKINAFRGQSKFWTWLYRVTSNTCKTMLVRHKRLNQHYSLEHAQQWEENHFHVQETESPDHLLFLEQQKEILYHVLNTLPKRYQRMMYLIYWKGYSYVQAAKDLNVPPHVFGVQLLRGRNLLFKTARPVFEACGAN